jgi:hypothetical protein|tara:strand:+ start:10967 stop:11887 length:921 start_codon:yes stop_codon:yes gene_type:complete
METYINKLIEVLPDKILNQKQPVHIDLILDGGAFNGSYLIGALMFLKEMEDRKYIKVDTISACSVSTLCGLLYFTDKLEYGVDMYHQSLCHVKTNHNLNIIDIYFERMRPLLTQELLQGLSKKLYCSYYNVKTRRKIIKSTYTNADDLHETMKRSSFLPYIINGKMIYKNKYIDGITPYKLPIRNNKQRLYIDLFGWGKITDSISVKNEKNNFHRILKGALDTQLFFMKGSSTSMCRYLSKWSDYNVYDTLFIKCVIEWFVIYYIYLVSSFEKMIINKNKYPGIYLLYKKFINFGKLQFINYICLS